MVQDNRHRGLLQFIKKVVEVPAGYSKDDLITFRSMATHQYPTLVSVIEEYIRLSENSDTDVPSFADKAKRSREISRPQTTNQMHLFDLLREKKLFPQNSDLVEFASRILPEMRSYRYDKMSKGDIASRVVEYLETLDEKTKANLEKSMRSAMSRSTTRPAERMSFLSTWEKIIKGIEL